MKTHKLIKKVILIIIFCCIGVSSSSKLVEASSVQNHEVVEFRGIEDDKAVIKPDTDKPETNNNKENKFKDQESNSMGFLPKTNEQRGWILSVLGILCMVIIWYNLKKREGDKG